MILLILQLLQPAAASGCEMRLPHNDAWETKCPHSAPCTLQDALYVVDTVNKVTHVRTDTRTRTHTHTKNCVCQTQAIIVILNES